MALETWELWYPAAAATGLPFARGRLDPTDVLLVHSAPDLLRVEVRDDDGRRLAFGDRIARDGKYFPMTRLRRDGERIAREDGWPTGDDIGTPVLLPGGEVGILKTWWNADDGSEWRWTVEFYNRR
jgi:hypothetical protein